MKKPEGHKNRRIDPDQVTYNIEPGIKQIREDLDKIVELQVRSLALLERIQSRGEKLFSPEIFPRAKKILTIEQFFSSNCFSLITCGQYLRNQALISKVMLDKLLDLATGQDPRLKQQPSRN